MTSPRAAALAQDDVSTPSLPKWLAKHVKVEYSADDISALIDSIDSSQLSQSETPTLPQLPAEILLLVLESVPIDHILDWRAVCRGFRDAIDGRVLFHHLQRTQLVGLMDTDTYDRRTALSPEQTDQLCFVNCKLQDVTNISRTAQRWRSKPIWDGTHAVFRLEDSWYKAFRDSIGVYPCDDTGLNDLHDKWFEHVDRLQLAGPESDFGALRWCIRLDHAVLDLAFPIQNECGATKFGLRVRLDRRTIEVRWKDMLFGFLKSEAMLRRKLENNTDSIFTFSPAEDCLREVRRQRLHASLNPDSKSDRLIKWSLRLLRPLFGNPQPSHSSTLQNVEDKAINTLLLLRREAAMTVTQKAYLCQLNKDRETMEKEIHDLSDSFDVFKSLMQPNAQFSLTIPFHTVENVPRDPIAWPDELRSIIEERVRKWKSQQKVMQQMSTLLASSNEALAVPEDSFDDLGSQI